jgi:hypothetical protein
MHRQQVFAAGVSLQVTTFAECNAFGVTPLYAGWQIRIVALEVPRAAFTSGIEVEDYLVHWVR